jgi:hypothetical protein
MKCPHLWDENLKCPHLWDATFPNVPVYGMKFSKCPHLWDKSVIADVNPHQSY